MFYIANSKQITVFFTDGSMAVWHDTDTDFNKVLDLCKKSDAVAVKLLDNTAKAVMEAEQVDVTFKGVKINGVEVESDAPLIKLIKVLQDNGVVDSRIEEIKPFLMNICNNPFIDASKELYDFLKCGDFEITDDGCFLAYKKVRNDLGSVHDHGKTKHKVGEYTEVKLYDTDRNKTCSCGLHFCSRNYLNRYSGDKVIVVKVNPKDVVSIPTDYNFEKGRCRKYLTVKVLEDGEFLDTMDTKTLDKSAGKVVRNESRIQQTVRLMKKYCDDVEEVAKVMGISVETVKRNLRKAKAMKKN